MLILRAYKYVKIRLKMIFGKIEQKVISYFGYFVNRFFKNVVVSYNHQTDTDGKTKKNENKRRMKK